jgi:hypothetical protein
VDSTTTGSDLDKLTTLPTWVGSMDQQLDAPVQFDWVKAGTRRDVGIGFWWRKVVLGAQGLAKVVWQGLARQSGGVQLNFKVSPSPKRPKQRPADASRVPFCAHPLAPPQN